MNENSKGLVQIDSCAGFAGNVPDEVCMYKALRAHFECHVFIGAASSDNDVAVMLAVFAQNRSKLS